MVALSPVAERHLTELTAHYDAKNRMNAVRSLILPVEAAKRRIARSPAAGLDAPRPYPTLKVLGFRWIRESNYWFAYSEGDPPVIAGIFYATADIPSRF